MRAKKWVWLAAAFLGWVASSVSVGAEEGVRLHEENFFSDHSLKGLFSSCEEYFQAGDWEIEGAELSLFYTVTTLVREEVSDFTVLLNGEPVYSQKLPLTAGETQRLTLPLPERLIREGANSVRVESYIRTNEEDPCEDDISGASWMTVRKDSYVSVSYRPAVECLNVADVYGQLSSIEGLENGESAVFLQGAPTENELTCAAYLLSGISGNAVLSYDSLALEEIEDQRGMAGYAYGVYVCEYDRLPPDMWGLLSKEQDDAARDGAVIAFVRTAGGTDLLLVTGREEQALHNACRLFGNRAGMEQTRTAWRKVRSSEDVNKREGEEQITVLTETGSYVSGPFRQTASFTVPMSASKSIAEGSEAQIYMRYAQNLDFDRSLVTAYIGDVPIGSKKLEKNSADGDVLRVSIPTNLDITGDFLLNITFDLEMKNMVCDIRRQDMPWAYVTGDSSVSLRTTEASKLLFDYYPGPFIYEGRWNNVVVVLPAGESEEDREAMRGILLAMGQYQTDNSGSIRVCRADNMGDLSAANVISIGALSDNPIVQQINNELYFRFSPKGTTIRSNEKMQIEPNYGATLGTAQLLYSPYSREKHALLVVSGVTREGVLHAADYLGDLQKNWQIYGDGFVTDGSQISCYRFGPDNGRTESYLEGLADQGSVVLLLVTGGGVLLLLSISLILIWNKHRKER